MHSGSSSWSFFIDSTKGGLVGPARKAFAASRGISKMIGCTQQAPCAAQGKHEAVFWREPGLSLHKCTLRASKYKVSTTGKLKCGQTCNLLFALF